MTVVETLAAVAEEGEAGFNNSPIIGRNHKHNLNNPIIDQKHNRSRGVIDRNNNRSRPIIDHKHSHNNSIPVLDRNHKSHRSMHKVPDRPWVKVVRYRFRARALRVVGVVGVRRRWVSGLRRVRLSLAYLPGL